MILTRKILELVLILTIGIGIGIGVPNLMNHLPFNNTSKLKPTFTEVNKSNLIPSTNTPTLSQSEEVNPEGNVLSSKSGIVNSEKYYARVQDGILTLYKGDSREGKSLLTGMNVKHWPKEMQALVTRIEFHSLDEVQSFIDSMSEELWIE